MPSNDDFVSLYTPKAGNEETFFGQLIAPLGWEATTSLWTWLTISSRRACRYAFDRAELESISLPHPEHLMLGLLQETDSGAAHLVDKAGMNRDKLIETLERQVRIIVSQSKRRSLFRNIHQPQNRLKEAFEDAWSSWLDKSWEMLIGTSALFLGDSFNCQKSTQNSIWKSKELEKFLSLARSMPVEEFTPVSEVMVINTHIRNLFSGIQVCDVDYLEIEIGSITHLHITDISAISKFVAAMQNACFAYSQIVCAIIRDHLKVHFRPSALGVVEPIHLEFTGNGWREFGFEFASFYRQLPEDNNV